MRHRLGAAAAAAAGAGAAWLAAAVVTVSAGTVYIAPSPAWPISSWRYVPGNADGAPRDARWRRLDFDDAQWLAGKAPFGYGVGGYVKYGTPLPTMRGGHTTLMLRKRFYVDDLKDTEALKLSVHFDDGFIAWINGAEVARHNAPSEPTPRSTATAPHAASPLQRFEVLAVSNASVRPGWNVLAVQLFNHALDDGSAHFDASLIDTRNLVLNRPAEVSSAENDKRFFQAYAAVDGTQLTFWSTKANEADRPQWIAVDLGGRFVIDKARLHWWGGQQPGVGGGAKDYQIQVSQDGQNWTTAADLREQNGGEDVVSFPPTAARHVRIYMTAHNRAASMGLLDLEIFEQGTPFDRREFASLSYGRPVTVSSEGWAGTPPFKAVDSNAGSWWASHPAAADPQWLAVDLESVRAVRGVKVMFSDRYAQRFAAEVSDDGSTWRQPRSTVDTEQIPSGDNHRIHRILFDAPQQTRHVRILLRDKNPEADRYAVTEFMVIGN